MYVDNELSAADRLSVETFVQEFPYLAEELELLKDMVLPLNDAIVIDKMNLYKTAALDEKVEEAMLLHLDNELPVSEKNILLQQMKTNATFKENWALLQKTILDAGEVISFPHKNLLYRKTAGRVVTARFVRLAVAAVFIAAGFFVGISILNNQDRAGQTVASTDISSPKSNTVSPGKTNEQLITVTDTTQVGAAVNKTQNKATVIAAAENKDKKMLKSTGKEDKQQPSYVALTSDAKQNKKQSPPADKKQEPANMIAANNPEDLKIKKKENAQTLTASINTTGKPKEMDVFENINPAQNTYAKLANMGEEEPNDNHIFLLEEEVVTHSKAGVFFKKLKRTVARTANIKTGNSLKIAGFEFAVK